MTGPIEALAHYHETRSAWTRATPRLGTIGAVRGGFDPERLPEPQLADIHQRTKDPHVLCVKVDDGAHLVQLLCPMPWWRGAQLTRELVAAGVHPLDIIIASPDMSTIADADPRFTLRDAVDWLFWTRHEQEALERAEQGTA